MPEQKFSCLVADDQMIDRDLLEAYVRKIDNLELVAVCSDGLEAATVLRHQPVDIVFSDIDMPNLSGMDLIRHLAHPPVFVFISAHPEHAAESFNLDIVDFIVKPLTLPRLLKAAEKAIAYIGIKRNFASADTPATPADADYFYIKDGTEHIQVCYPDIVYIESMGNFSRLHTLQGKKHVTLVGLKNVEHQLPTADFLRIHKQHLVNLRHVVSVSSDGQVTLRTGETLIAGGAYRARLMELVNRRTLLR